MYDVVLGRSEASLSGYQAKLKGKEDVRVVCMNLSCCLPRPRQTLPQCPDCDRPLHLVRLTSQQFLAVWRRIDAAGSKNRGLLSLMRRHASNLRPEAGKPSNWPSPLKAIRL